MQQVNLELTLFEELQEIRNNGSETAIIKFIKKFSDDSNVEILNSILKDIEYFLFYERDLKEAEFSSFDIDFAIEERKKNGLEIPYNKRRSLDELTERQKENRLRIDSKNTNLPHENINIEQLLFPFEFYDIYQLKFKIENAIQNDLKTSAVLNNGPISKKLSINQIALKLVYSNSTVNKENADSTIKEYGHNSGHKLYQAFNFYYKKANRIGHDVESETKKILDNKIKLLESVIELVQDDFKQKAIDECKTLRSHLFKY